MSEFSELNDDELAAIFHACKDSIKDYEEKIKDEKELIKEIDGILQRRMAERGQTAIATPHGTIHTVTRTSARVMDPAATISWLKEKDLWQDAVVLKLNSSWVKSYEIETGEKVPGAELFTFVTLGVTPPKKRT